MDQTNSVQPQKSNTCASVITYHPDDDTWSRIRAVTSQVDKVVVVDNDSGPAVVERLSVLCGEIGAELILNDENKGLAAALNQALGWAESRDYRWLLTMDQDSCAFDDVMNIYTEVWKSFPHPESLAVIGGNYVDKHNGTQFHATKNEDCWTEVEAVITSGSMVSVAAAVEIGGFREDFFVDQVDFEMCLRARSKGYRVVITRDPVMSHVVSVPIKKRLLGRMISTPNTSALRRYYLARNHLAVMREYIFKEPKWVWGATKARGKEFMLMLLLEDGKLIKTIWTIRGVWDGVFGRMGQVGER